MLGGYGWHPVVDRSWPDIDDFHPAIEAIWKLLNPGNFPNARLEQVHIVGFSQGAALGYGLALSEPQRVGLVAGLSGFVPGGGVAGRLWAIRRKAVSWPTQVISSAGCVSPAGGKLCWRLAPGDIL
jgi:pimeloyl-ACP methyl ester carboxylesterase